MQLVAPSKAIICRSAEGCLKQEFPFEALVPGPLTFVDVLTVGPEER